MEDVRSYLVIYHYPCMDGAYSCLALYMYYKCFGSKYKLSFSPIKSGSNLNKCLLTEEMLNYDKIFILN